MSWRTNSLVVLLRDFGRKIGINNLIADKLFGEGYEASYDQTFSSNIKSGDCVWDIGANVGYYTKIFSERVTQEGKIFSFEPSQVNFSKLNQNCAGLKNVTLFQHGLGKSDSKMYFSQGEDSLGATSHVSYNNTKDGIVVEIRSADSLISEGKVVAPNVIKMDVEGYEWEILEGMSSLIKNSKLRVVGIEVHFGILKKREMNQVPKQIEELFRTAGFSIKWCDSSHIIAIRD